MKISDTMNTKTCAHFFSLFAVIFSSVPKKMVMMPSMMPSNDAVFLLREIYDGHGDETSERAAGQSLKSF